MKTNGRLRNHYRLALVALCALLTLSGMALAQHQGGPPDGAVQAPDPLHRLTQAIADAGAAALSTDQQTALTALITKFQADNAPTPTANKTSYDTFILAGNDTSAIALLPTLANERTAQELARAKALTTFAVAVVKLIQPQLSFLQKSLGVDGLVGLIQSLAGGPGRPGGHGM